MPLLKEVPKVDGHFERYEAVKAKLRGMADSWTDASRTNKARGFCTKILEAYWYIEVNKLRSRWLIKRSPFTGQDFTPADIKLAEEIADILSEFDTKHAGYYVGTLYTLMLPATTRSSLGAFYTPPAVVDRLMDLAEQAGMDFSRGTAIDPACGGGAFLAPVAQRMLEKEPRAASAEDTLKRIAGRLKGVEIDPFAAWMSEVLLEVSLLPLCVEAERRLPKVVQHADTLKIGPQDLERYDLVIGNPPYGRPKIDEDVREKFSRSIYGHANLYGMFFDLATQLTKEDGVVAFVTPTSLLGGQYFKALRTLLTRETCAASIDFVSDREGVFDDVLQETMLSTFTKKAVPGKTKVSNLDINDGVHVNIESYGQYRLKDDGEPWFLPRTTKQSSMLAALQAMPTRLSDLGYSVSTGQLVWNRHKKQLRSEKGKGTFHLVWAESVTGDGFKLSSARRNHEPYIKLTEKQEFLMTKQTCVLVQRTTSKEQPRRLSAAVLPKAFLRRNRAVVVENHLNMISADGGSGVVSTKTIEALLNSEIVDQAFRCISGSVAVSAYELNALPLPAVTDLVEIEKLLCAGKSKAFIDQAIASYYAPSR
ncbi:MAG TPA: N-6 DNA methylase [bacterium]|jgi:adenine-specific DNA-methyltransferase|nr:N-6 DNA methylase [bacterium]